MIRDLRYRAEFRFWRTVNWLAGKLGYIPTETYVIMNDEWRDLCEELMSLSEAYHELRADHEDAMREMERLRKASPLPPVAIANFVTGGPVDRGSPSAIISGAISAAFRRRRNRPQVS